MIGASLSVDGTKIAFSIFLVSPSLNLSSFVSVSMKLLGDEGDEYGSLRSLLSLGIIVSLILAS